MQPWKAFGLALVMIAIIGILGGALLVWRGFRATNTPSRLEAGVARGLRNLAIPGRVRKEKMPLESDEANLQAGRDIFLAQCANCHGHDGSGSTPVGTNLYPRVPDLRVPQTQNLSDGELRYIIENGVQLTGMPAWKNPNQTGDREIWQLVIFIRSLRPLNPGERELQAKAMGSAHNAGSPSCEKCHASIYQSWKKTPMANIVRDPRQVPEAIPADPTANNVFKFSKEQVAFVYGSLWKQRFFTKVGDDYFPLPVQWEVANHKWSKYMVPAGGNWWASVYPPDNMKRPTGPLCDGCHSVGYNIHTKQVAEWNAGCEACHGPGSEHVNHATRGNIINPAHMDYVSSNDTCIQCHSQGQPVSNPIEGKYYDWPVGYRVGLKLADYWKLEEHKLGESNFYYFADGTAHKNRMQGNDFAQSVMYRRGVTCFDCHDMHGTKNYAQLRQPAEKICLACHGPMSANGPRTATLEEHTHHKEGSSGSQCVACHMPAIETEGVPNTFVHAHTFDSIRPAATENYKIPNPCTSCHNDKSTSWASDAMRQWTERSPWRLN